MLLLVRVLKFIDTSCKYKKLFLKFFKTQIKVLFCSSQNQDWIVQLAEAGADNVVFSDISSPSNKTDYS